MELLIIGILTLIVGIAGVVIMYQQKKISKKQLKLNSFEKVFNIYSLSQDFVVKIVLGWVTIEECADYFKKMDEANYLLTNDLNELISRIHSSGLELAHLNSSIKVYENNLNHLSEANRIERKEYMSKKSELLKTIPALREELRKQFEDVLSMQ